MLHENVEHVAIDAAGTTEDGYPPVKLLVEFDQHGLTIKRQGPDGEAYSDSYLCLDLSEGVVRVYASDSESENGNIITEWNEFGFEEHIPIHDLQATREGHIN